MRLLIVALAALLIAAADPVAKPSKIPGIAPGSKAPEAAGIVLQGPEGIRLGKLKGKVVVVDFWATWCGPCQESLPELDALYKDLKAAGKLDDFEMLGVTIDQNSELPRRYLEKRPLSYPIVNDVAGIATQTYGLWRFPATFLIDPDGYINYIYWGYGKNFSADLRRRALLLIEAKNFKEREKEKGGAAG